MSLDFLDAQTEASRDWQIQAHSLVRRMQRRIQTAESTFLVSTVDIVGNLCLLPSILSEVRPPSLVRSSLPTADVVSAC